MVTDDGDPFAQRRQLLRRSLAREISDERILDAFAAVPRERFVAQNLRELAYENRPLPIGYGQTISQPLMVALMLQELSLQGTERVLDIGTGSGYQAALLSRLAAYVVSVELIPQLAEQAVATLQTLGYANIEVHVAGEALGWPQGGPYDAIIVAAASPRVPQSLVDQLAPEGRLVIPVGSREMQDLLVVRASREGLVVTRKGACGFVPLIGKEAFSRPTDST